MTRILSFIALFAFLLTSCEGPQGPPGFDGFNGQDGLNGLDGDNGEIIAASAFEIELDFNEANDYQLQEPFGFEVFPTDVTLVYVLWETVDGQNVWRLTPQTVTFDDGTLVYNYDFTQTDVLFFLEGSTNFATLDTSYTLNQLFRVVVIPADNIGRTNFQDLEAVMQRYNIKEFSKR